MGKIKASVIGASGYGGAETVRLLTTHPQVDIVHVTAESQQGQVISDLYPNLRHFIDQTMIAVDAERIGRDSDVTFVSLPSGKAMHLVPALLEQGNKVIDIAADFRLHDPALYPTWYKCTHVAPQYLAEAVYGLPELHHEAIAQTRLLANPGCYPVAALLALIPLLRAGVIHSAGIIIDAKSGVSGKGVDPPHLLAVDARKRFVPAYRKSVVGKFRRDRIEHDRLRIKAREIGLFQRVAQEQILLDLFTRPIVRRARIEAIYGILIPGYFCGWILMFVDQAECMAELV